jgi:hypothetical protein
MAWSELKKVIEDDACFVGAGTRHDADEGFMNGVVGGHAYSIFHALEIGDDIKILLLRNPWGHVRNKSTD